MGLFDQFPYTNFHELNLDWILKALKELEHTIDQFVAINALKYADPIQWDITSQYEKNTIVIDPQTGTAYISVQPVPIGVALTNPDYWTVVFDLGSFVVRAAKNLANTYEAETTLTATVNTPAGGWLVWGDTLYKALVNITAGDSYVEGGNIEHFTIEEVIGHLEDLNTTNKSNLVAAINEVAIEVLGKIGDLADLNTTDKSNLVAAINEVISNAGDLTDLTTTDKSNLVAAINEVLSTLNSTTGNLADLNTTDKSDLVAAINEVNTTGGGALALIGDLADLDTTDKSDLVAAINEVVNDIGSVISSGAIITPEMYGAEGDGVTDDTAAINTMYQNAAGKICVFTGTYLVDGHTSNTTADIDFYSAGIQVTSNSKTYFASGSSVKMMSSNTATSSVFTLIGLENVEIHGATIIGDYDTHQQISGTTDEWCHGITAYGCKNLLIDGATVKDCFGDGIYIGQFPYYGGTIPSDNHSKNVTIQNTTINHCGRNGITIGECDRFLLNNINIDGVARTAPMAGIDVEQEGDYSPIVKNGFIQNITAKNCGSDSIKVTLVTGGATYIQNVFGAQQIYLQSNTVTTYILNVEAPIFVAQCGAEIRNSTINPVKLDTTGTVRIDNCRITWAQGSVIANLFVTNSIITNCRGYKNQIRFNNCMFLYPGSYSYMVWLEDGYIYAEFIGCTFNYGSYTSGHSWIYEEADTGQLIVMNCHAQGSGSPTFTYAVNNRGTGDMINGNAYKPYTNMCNAAPATGCVNINA